MSSYEKGYPRKMQRPALFRKTAIDFFNKLFYLKVDRLDDVLILINEQFLQKLEKIWAIEEEELLVKEGE